MVKRRTKTPQERLDAKKKFKNKPVTFNSADPDEAILLEWSEKRTNFSRYVKTLIQRDRDSTLSGTVLQPVSWTEDESKNTITKDDAEGFI